MKGDRNPKDERLTEITNILNVNINLIKSMIITNYWI